MNQLTTCDKQLISIHRKKRICIKLERYNILLWNEQMTEANENEDSVK
jgi:hypothetical protein